MSLWGWPHGYYVFCPNRQNIPTRMGIKPVTMAGFIISATWYKKWQNCLLTKSKNESIINTVIIYLKKEG